MAPRPLHSISVQTCSLPVRQQPVSSISTVATTHSSSFETTNAIASAQAKLPDGQHTSQRIKRLYRKRSRRRDHAVNALLRDLVERLEAAGVSTLYHGDLTGVLGEYWSVEANLKAQTFWAHRQCIDRLESVCEEYGINVETLSEAWTSQTCPDCGDRERTRRHRETLTCPCGFDGHADLVASRTLLEWATDTSQADGTARAVPVGRSPVVSCRGSRSDAQRIAHRPARCRRSVLDAARIGRSHEWSGCRPAGRLLFEQIRRTLLQL